MVARAKKSQASLYLVFVLLVVVLGWLLFTKFKSNSVNVGTSAPSVSKQTAKPVASQTGAVAQGAMSGPVGRNGLRTYAGPGVGEVTLEWQRFFSDGENFSIHYGIQSKQYPYAVSHVGYIAIYTVKGLTPGTKYFFAVEGIRVGDVSAGSDGEVSMVAPGSPVTVIGTSGPVGRNMLTVKPGPRSGQATLNWTRFYPDTEKYHIVYGIAPGKYIYGLLNAIDTTPGDNNYSYTIGSLKPGTRYYFALEPQRSGTAIYSTSEVSVIAP